VRRIVFFLGVAMVMLVVAAGVAVAVEKTCENVPCTGTDQDDELHERERSVKDRILGFDGNDLLDANNYGNDRDRLKGGPQGDRLLSNDNDRRDGVEGGRGNDRCIVDRGDNTQSCSVSIQAAPATLQVDVP
jgi:hypothetical protein